MKALLLAGYRPNEALGLKDHARGNVLNYRIEQLQNLGFEVVVVLSGTHADEQLRACPALVKCELIFDDGGDSVNLVSNIRSALTVTKDAFFIQPVEVPCPERSIWQFLRNEAGKLGPRTEIPALQAVDEQGAPCQLGFPLLITPHGNKVIRKNAEIRSLLDPQLRVRHLAYRDDSL